MHIPSMAPARARSSATIGAKTYSGYTKIIPWLKFAWVWSIIFLSFLPEATPFSVIGTAEWSPDFTNEASRQLWNETLFENMPTHLAYYRLQNEMLKSKETITALEAIEELTCLNFTQMSLTVQRCRDPWTICTTLDSEDSLVFTTSQSGQNWVFSATSSPLGIAASVVAALGLRHEINRSDRDDFVQIRYEMLRSDVINPESAPARAFVSQLFVKCGGLDTHNEFDYFSITFGDVDAFQNDDIPVVVTRNPHDMWKLYMRMPTNPKLSVYDRFYLTEKQCSKELNPDGTHCDPHLCRHGFLLHDCLCLCLPGYTGPKCDTALPSEDLSASLGFSLPPFPISLAFSLAWVHSGLEMVANPPSLERRFLWSAKLEAPEGSRMHVALFPTHFLRHLTAEEEAKSASGGSRVHARLMYTYAGPTQYRVLHLDEHVPIVRLAPRVRSVTLLLLAHGERPLAPLLAGSPLVVRHEPEPRFHLSLARSPRAPAVLLAELVTLSQLPAEEPQPLQVTPTLTTPEPLPAAPEADPLRHYLPLVLGIVCGLWFILLAVSILCYVQSERRGGGGDASLSPPPPALSPRPLRDEGSSGSDSSSDSPGGGSLTSAATTVAATSDDSHASAHVHFTEPPVAGSAGHPTPPTDRRASMYSSVYT